MSTLPSRAVAIRRSSSTSQSVPDAAAVALEHAPAGLDVGGEVGGVLALVAPVGEEDGVAGRGLGAAEQLAGGVEPLADGRAAFALEPPDRLDRPPAVLVGRHGEGPRRRPARPSGRRSTPARMANDTPSSRAATAAPGGIAHGRHLAGRAHRAAGVDDDDLGPVAGGSTSARRRCADRPAAVTLTTASTVSAPGRQVLVLERLGGERGRAGRSWSSVSSCVARPRRHGAMATQMLSAPPWSLAQATSRSQTGRERHRQAGAEPAVDEVAQRRRRSGRSSTGRRCTAAARRRRPPARLRKVRRRRRGVAAEPGGDGVAAREREGGTPDRSRRRRPGRPRCRRS